MARVCSNFNCSAIRNFLTLAKFWQVAKKKNLPIGIRTPEANLSNKMKIVFHRRISIAIFLAGA
jgi:hypothetical protein